MADIETVLAKIETARANGHLVDDLTMSSVLVQVHDRSQLERLFPTVPRRDLLVDRANLFLRQEQQRECSAQELVDAARGHLRELRSLVDRQPFAPPGAAELVDAVLALPYVVVDEADARPDAVELRGVGEQVSEVPAPSAPLSADDVRRLVGVDAWTVHEMTSGESEQAHEALTYLYGPLHDHAHLAHFLVAPALADPFDFGHYYLLWEAEATLWIATDRVEVRRGTAARWAFDEYGYVAQPVDVPVDDELWAQSTGKAGAKALATLHRARDEQSTLLDVQDLGLTSLPPSVATEETILRVSLVGNRFIKVPPEIYQMPWLQVLNMSANRLDVIDPRLFTALPMLEIFNARSNAFTTVPDEITSLANLHRLDLSDGKLNALPENIGDLTSLRRLFLGGTELVTLPSSVGQLHDLELLAAGNSKLRSLPATILNLPDSTEVDFYGSELPRPLHSVHSIAELRDVWPPDWPTLG